MEGLDWPLGTIKSKPSFIRSTGIVGFRIAQNQATQLPDATNYDLTVRNFLY